MNTKPCRCSQSATKTPGASSFTSPRKHRTTPPLKEGIIQGEESHHYYKYEKPKVFKKTRLDIRRTCCRKGILFPWGIGRVPDKKITVIKSRGRGKRRYVLSTKGKGGKFQGGGDRASDPIVPSRSPGRDSSSSKEITKSWGGKESSHSQKGCP